MKYSILVLLLLSSTSSLLANWPANVNVAAVTKTELRPTAWVSGEVVSPNNSTIATEVNGRVTMLAELGSQVSMGDVIAKIDDSRLVLRVRENEASVASNKARYEFLASEVKRIAALAERNLSAKTELDRIKSERDAARNELAEAESRLAQVKQDIAYATIRAPFDGLITHRLGNVGEFLQVGSAILRMVETSNTEATLSVPITSFPYIKVGELVALESDIGNQTAPVKAIIPVAESRSHLMEVRLNLSQVGWPIGLKLRAAVPNAEAKEVVALPRDALVLRREGVFVFLVKEGVAEQVPVKVGIAQGALVEVSGAVQPGDQVIIRGAERIQPGQAVVIKESNDHLVSGK